MRTDKTRISAWAGRWSDTELILGAPSPFGLTETGLQDYRGARIRHAVLRSISISDADFSGADLRNIRIENGELRNCIFEGASLVEMITRESNFNRCDFRRADLRMAHIGYGGTDFTSCTFDGVKIARVGFLNAVFTDVNFSARDWKRTDFRASGFWNCSFRGLLEDVTFRGDYLLPSHREISGPPRKTGLHNVSFEGAELHWVGFYNGCQLENITLPADGSAFQCRVRDLVALYADYDEKAIGFDEFTRYLGIIRPNSSEQNEEIVSAHDLIKIGGTELGTMLYANLKSGTEQTH